MFCGFPAGVNKIVVGMYRECRKIQICWKLSLTSEAPSAGGPGHNDQRNGHQNDEGSEHDADDSAHSDTSGFVHLGVIGTEQNGIVVDANLVRST